MTTRCAGIVIFLSLAATALCLSAGCAMPHAAVDGRSLTGHPVPAGRMAMLPPILSPTVQEPQSAIDLCSEITDNLKQAGLNVTYDDLGGRLGPRSASTQAMLRMISRPGTAATQTRPASRPTNRLTLSQRYRDWHRQGFDVVIQPVVRSYGTYRRYKPPQLVGHVQYWAQDVDTGWYGGWGEGPNPGWEPNWGGSWSEDRPSGSSPGDYGVFMLPYQGYAMSQQPGGMTSVATISIEYQFFDVASRQHIYYILATGASDHYQPAQLRGAFSRPLIWAFREAHEKSSFQASRADDPRGEPEGSPSRRPLS